MWQYSGFREHILKTGDKFCLFCLIMLFASFHTSVVHAQTGNDEQPPSEAEVLAPTKLDGKSYSMTQIRIVYDQPDPQLPPVEELNQLEVVLAQTQNGDYVSWREGMDQVRTTIGDMPSGTYYASSILLISKTIVNEFTRRGFLGVYVGPDPKQFDSLGRDLRQDTKKIKLIVRLATASNVRTIAAGKRIPPEGRINNEMHRKIVQDSPVQPYAEGDGERQDFIRKDELDRYLSFLNRHPGRRVDVSVSPGSEPNSVALDYLISENKPWMVYYQLSNTGTQNTGEWRHRLGYINNQVTNNDDILSIDYITSGFEDANALIASYNAPLSDDGRLRYQLGAQLSEYTASDVGFANEDFKGEEYILYGELIQNVYQQQDFFLDLVLGIHYRNVFVDNEGISVEHRENFVMPYIGLRLEEKSQKEQLFGQLTIESIADTLTNPSRGGNGSESGKLDNLGRLYPDEGGTIIKWDLTHSFFLEPVLNPEAWLDTSTPDTSTLAHEIAIGFKGQVVLNNQRVTPQFQRTAGGLYSVRGYEESLTAGDNALIVTIEYRYHLPRALGINPNPDETPLFGQPFRWSPQNVYGRPDWDLILRSFVDYGRITNNDQEPTFEDQHDLFGAGVGLELLYKHNLSFRIDWGVALNDVDVVGGNTITTEGSSQVHIVTTFIY